jgi:ketosteroid isomerase-like protein
MADNHMDDYALDVVDMLGSDDRVAVVARTTGRRGDARIQNDFIQLIEIRDGRIVEVWNYVWDQRAIAEFMAHAM